MNGRIYDPHLGRFLQADPFVEDRTTLNRYTYVHNNPLAYSDPSGYFSWKKTFKQVAGLAITIASIAYGDSVGGWTGFWTMTTGAFVGGYLATGTVRGAFTSSALVGGTGSVIEFRRQGASATESAGEGSTGTAVDPNIAAISIAAQRTLLQTLTVGRTVWEQDNLAVVMKDGMAWPPDAEVVTFAYGSEPSHYRLRLETVKEGVPTLPSRETNLWYWGGMGVNAAGLAASAGELSNVRDGQWRSRIQRKWYSKRFFGNQYTERRREVVRRASAMRAVGQVAFGVGTFIEGSQGVSALMEGNYGGVAHSTANISMGYIGTFGGLPGLIAAGSYYAIDYTVGIDSLSGPLTDEMCRITDDC